MHREGVERKKEEKTKVGHWAWARREDKVAGRQAGRRGLHVQRPQYVYHAERGGVSRATKWKPGRGKHATADTPAAGRALEQ